MMKYLIIFFALVSCSKELKVTNVYINGDMTGNFAIVLAQNVPESDSVIFDNTNIICTDQDISLTTSYKNNELIHFWEVREDTIVEIKYYPYTGQDKYIEGLNSGVSDELMSIHFKVLPTDSINSRLNEMNFIKSLSRFKKNLLVKGVKYKSFEK